MSVRIYDLTPGDEVTSLDISATFVGQMNHPLYRGLQLVIWWLPEEGRWSHDALDIRQEVGDLTPSTPEDRKRRLRAALTPGVDRG